MDKQTIQVPKIICYKGGKIYHLTMEPIIPSYYPKEPEPTGLSKLFPWKQVYQKEDRWHYTPELCNQYMNDAALGYVNSKNRYRTMIDESGTMVLVDTLTLDKTEIVYCPLEVTPEKLTHYDY